MEVLVAQGKILYVGSSNSRAGDIARASETARARGFLGLVSEQSLYNLLARTIELEVLPAAIAYGVGVIPCRRLAAGCRRRLKVRARGPPPARSVSARETGRGKPVEVSSPTEDLCDKLGTARNPPTSPLAWP